jgi:RNA polymerase sigma-70 factor (sigma-E family)
MGVPLTSTAGAGGKVDPLTVLRGTDPLPLIPALASGAHPPVAPGAAEGPGPTDAYGAEDASSAEDGSGAEARGLASVADQAVAALYRAEYRSLVRMATMLVGDPATAEEVVQDCFVGMHSAFWRLRDMDKALNYLRRSVVNRARSVMRRRVVAGRYLPRPGPDMPSAEQGALARIERSAVFSALRTLPVRQREAIVLRFYLDLSEDQVAGLMKISRGAVKAHTARGKAALRGLLREPG